MPVKTVPAPKVPKGDPSKPYDVSVAVIHDDRQGKSTPVQATKRYSFATEGEALEFAQKIADGAL